MNSPSRIASPRAAASVRGMETNGDKLMAIVICIGVTCFGAFWFAPRYTEYNDIHKSQSVLNEFPHRWMQEQSKTLSRRLHSSPSYQNVSSLLAVEPFSQTSGINVWDWFIPTLSCPDLERIGKVGEGGKWMCGVKHLAPRRSLSSDSQTSSHEQLHTSSSSACVAYSFGISNDISFEVDLLLRTSCEIHCFDPTIGQLPFDELPSNSRWERALKIPGFRDRFTFHKVALGNVSGATEMHAISESIFDIMRKHNHDFIDILKIDVEGGEWSVFNSLYHQQHIKAFPVGQLLIELHYSNMYDVTTLFNALASWNMHPFSREINLIPCLNGGLPFAVEYSFINPMAYFEDNKQSFVLPLSTAPTAASPLTASNLRKQDQLNQQQALPVVSSEQVKSVVYLLTMRSRIPKLLKALSLFYDNYWKDYPIPLVVFHDDFSKSDEVYIQKSIPSLRIDFVKITFQIPFEIESKFDIPDRTKCDPKFSTVGYRHMCTFHAEEVHRYLLDDKNKETKGKYSGVEFIWRLDDDSHITAPIGYDIMKFMSYNNLKYGFVNTVQDDVMCVDGLWEHSREFVKQYSMTSDSSPSDSDSAAKTIASHFPPPNNFFNEWPEPLVIYNNFEISHVSLWKSKVWKAYFKSIEEMGGIYRFRWGDAPIHTIAISMMLNRSQLHSFTDVGYKHAPFIDQKAQGLDMPNIDPFLSNYVDCHYYDKWRCQSKYLVANSTFNASNASNAFHSLDLSKISEDDIEKDRFLKFALDIPSTSSSSFSKVISSNSLKGSTLKLSANDVIKSLNPQDVFYSFGYSGKETVLLETIESFYDHYLNEFPTPMVIFYEKSGSFNVDLMILKLKLLLPHYSTAIHSKLFQFVGIVINSELLHDRNAYLDKQCSNDHTNIVKDNVFFQYQAIEELSALGYDWFFRFNFNSHLLKKIHYNVFDYMKVNKLRYGYVDTLSDSSSQCLSSIWSLGRDHCKALTSSSSASSSAAASRCGDLFDKWPENNAIITSFAVAHKSVYTSPLCTNLLNLQDKTSVTNSLSLPSKQSYGGDIKGLSYKYSDVMNWPDSATHTLCVLLTLKHSELVKLPGIEYKLLWQMKSSLSTGDSGEVKDTSSSVVSDKYELKSLPDYDKMFSLQRLGWLGGDIATSVPLPPLDGSLVSNSGSSSIRQDGEVAQQVPNKLLWLYGDSIIGIANKDQRIQEYSSFISNTVGISTFTQPASTATSTPCETDTVKSVSQVKYYWRQNSEGMPAAIFTLNHDQDLCARNGYGRSASSEPVGSTSDHINGDISVWPITGITVLNEDKKGFKLAVVASIACRQRRIDHYYHTGEKDDLEEEIKKDDQFDFKEVANAVFIVGNPEASPELWRYEYKIVPTFSHLLRNNVLRLISMTESSGQPYCDANGLIYILGTHQLENVENIPYGGGFQVLLRIKAVDLLRLDLDQLSILQEEEEEKEEEGRGKDGDKEPYKQSPTWRSLASTATAQFKPKELYKPITTEASLVKYKNNWIVASLRFIDRYVQICESENLMDNWMCYNVDFSQEVGKASVALNSQPKNYISYAAKIHLYMSAINSNTESCSENQKDDKDDSLKFVISLMSNTLEGPSKLFEPQFMTVYTPRFFILESK